MPQVSLYLKEKTYANVKRAAEAESVSVSKWISKKLERTMAAAWPDGFNELFGSIVDDSFKAPLRDAFLSDSKRDRL